MAAGQGRQGRAQGPRGAPPVALRVAARNAGYAARVLREAARAWALDGEALSLSLVTDREMRALNRTYRGLDKPTDVLSWDAGDIVISLDTARRQAREGGWPLRTELRRLLAHGLAHARGHDHGNRQEARRMAAAERKMLGAQGMVGDAFSQTAVPTRRKRR